MIKSFSFCQRLYCRWNYWAYHLPQIAYFTHCSASENKPLMLREAADSSLQPGCTRSGCTVSSPQSFFLPKEFGQTRDQFPQQTSKLRLSHLAHTRFFWRGWWWWAAKIQAPRGANYHIEEICLVFQEDNVQHEVHTGCHTHNGLTHTHTERAGWRRHKCTSWCSLKVCKHVRIRTNTGNMMPSHIFSHTSGWLSAQVQRRERTRDRRDVAHFPNNLPGPRLHQLHFHTQRKSTAYQQPMHARVLGMASFLILIWREKKDLCDCYAAEKRECTCQATFPRSRLWFE